MKKKKNAGEKIPSHLGDNVTTDKSKGQLFCVVAFTKKKRIFPD